MIRVESLTRTYGDHTAVDQVSFEIGQGEIVGLLGHNGAGKTTIMKMLTGFLEPTSGSIEMHGMSIHSHREAIQRQLGYLPENCPVYPEMTVIDYLDYAAALHGVAKTERGVRIRAAIARTELEPRAMEMINTLSRGYQQRVGVAQAILHNPTILILDEPTNGLDPTQIQHMRSLIKTLAKSATIMLSTHILPEVQAVCDRVIIIQDGRKVLDARLDALQVGHRLRLLTDAGPEQAEPLFNKLAPVTSVETSAGDGNRHLYTLTIEGDHDPTDSAPAVAQALIEAGFKLFTMAPESRDLETIFGELSASDGGQNNG
ncbi:MAG: ATP-binding cassette domain-containing protein [bacterium]|nr:ATP-binding cassette domain-containing protein [bacterium]